MRSFFIFLALAVAGASAAANEQIHGPEAEALIAQGDVIYAERESPSSFFFVVSNRGRVYVCGMTVVFQGNAVSAPVTFGTTCVGR